MRKSRVKGRCPHCLNVIGVPIPLSIDDAVPLECAKCGKKLRDVPNTRKNWEARQSQCIKCWNHGDGKKKKPLKLTERACRLCGSLWRCYPSYIKRRVNSRLRDSAFCVQCRAKFKKHNCIVIKDRASKTFLVRPFNGRKYVSIWDVVDGKVSRKRTEWIPLARFMVECFIGRKLNGNRESVHHKNHDKMDDRIENLSVKSASEHIKEHCAEQKKNPT